jgi:hypothetical protein
VAPGKSEIALSRAAAIERRYTSPVAEVRHVSTSHRPKRFATNGAAFVEYQGLVILLDAATVSNLPHC